MIHHGAVLRKMNPIWTTCFSKWEEGDYSCFNEKEQHLLQAARELSQTPPYLSEDTFQLLKDDGWNDEAIVRIITIVAYFHFVNRVMIGLDVQLEQELSKEKEILFQKGGS